MEKLNTMATGGNLPDCGLMSEAGVLQWAEQGMLADVSEMYGEDEAKPLASATYTYDGATVAYATANNSLVLYYNKDMFDAAGLPYPPANAEDAWTWDEFVEVAKQLTLDANGKNAADPSFDPNNIVQYGCMIENLPWQLEVWCRSNGSGFYNEDGTEVTINDPAAIEALQKIADLYLVHHVAPLSSGLTDDGVQRSLIAGTCAMTTNGAWNIGTCLSAAREEGLNYGIGVLPYMKEKVTISTGGPNVVFSQTEHPEEAMEFIKWYSREENSWDSLIAAGIWMPTTSGYYEDEELTTKWLDNPAYPPMEEAKPVLFNYILKSIGIDNVLFLNDSKYVIPSLALISVWLSGNSIVIFLAGLQNVPRVYHEAAEIDGANGFQRFLHVTLPSMTPIIFYNLLMSLITNMQVVTPALSLTNGGPGKSSMFITYLMYRYAFKSNQIDYACAISFIFFILIAIFTGIVFSTSKTWIYYEGGEE